MLAHVDQKMKEYSHQNFDLKISENNPFKLLCTPLSKKKHIYKNYCFSKKAHIQVTKPTKFRNKIGRIKLSSLKTYAASELACSQTTNMNQKLFQLVKIANSIRPTQYKQWNDRPIAFLISNIFKKQVLIKLIQG